MVLESVLRSQFALKHPFSMLIFGIVITFLGAGMALTTFPNAASVLSIAFITIGTIPLLFHTLSREEKHEIHAPGNPATFFGRHFHLISLYGYFFLGLIIAHAYLYSNLSPDFRSQLFEEQENTYGQIENLRGKTTEGEFENACKSDRFWPLSIGCIFSNNAVVLGWTLFMSFIFGAGAIFLIAWNASVIGLVIGQEILASDHFQALGKFGCLLPHGIPEVGAYFIGAIAGGIISAAIAQKVYRTDKFRIIAQDVIVMIILAYLLLFFGSLIEGANIISSCFTQTELVLAALS
ncbi:MAG: stage II sporulation protein M [Candidatus Diapherotrites archaeon]|uniref:Stage II sporulation protein M n=1 Tax=Candidatus Iainarchaeum sp. TaxID=3101447 RepID=A0A8T4L5J7_9ARCH|nr:stage II sporulation protein M [Candidatus Diapherotrites archaeon]